MTTPQAEWARVTQFDAGKAQHEDLVVMLRIHFQRPTLLGTQPAPVQSTLPLYLTERQAKNLLLLLGHALGMPGTGIPDSPGNTTH
jgi:hypothetical protein